MASFQTGTVAKEKPDLKGNENVERSDQAIDQDRDTFLPRPSDDPEDPLNWTLSLKVSIGMFVSSDVPFR
jgi:hypothetical protein